MKGVMFFTPLCPAGHLPTKGGDHIGICTFAYIVLAQS